MSCITSEENVLKLQHIFNRFGVPETLVFDYGIAFTSVKFSDFCQQNGINHMHTLLIHLQSNGQIEQFVNTFKRAFQKLKGEGTVTETLETFSYRATPNTNTPNGSLPAEVMLNCKICLYVDIIQPNTQNYRKRNTAMKQQFNCHHIAVNHIA